MEKVAIGTDALGACTTGINNIAIGDDACLVLTVATSCIGIGRDALLGVTTGIENTAIGDQAGNTITTGDGNTIVGNNGQTGSATAVDRIVLSAGSGASGTADSAGTIGSNARAISCDYGTDQTWDAPSDLRMKNVVRDSTLGLSFIRSLRPIEYTWKHPSEWPEAFRPDDTSGMNTERVVLGMGAQDVKAALDAEGGKAAFHGWSELASGQQLIGESAFVYPLINAVKELAAEIENLKRGKHA